MTLPARHEPYRRADLRPLYDPKSVAIIGASARPTSFGARTAANLKGFFGGRTYLVNDKYERLGEVPCYPSLRALPENPRCRACHDTCGDR